MVFILVMEVLIPLLVLTKVLNLVTILVLLSGMMIMGIIMMNTWSASVHITRVSKNFKLKHTLYTGYGRILGVERDEGTGIFDGTTQGYEERHIIDFGYIFKTKSIALTIGLPLHLPRYKYEEHFEGREGYEDIDSGAKFRPQIGIGYIL